MTPWVSLVASGLAELYLLATVVLVAAALAMRTSRQPARRLEIVRWASLSLLVLVGFVLLAGIVRSRTLFAAESSGESGATGSLDNKTDICCTRLNNLALAMATSMNPEGGASLASLLDGQRRDNAPAILASSTPAVVRPEPEPIAEPGNREPAVNLLVSLFAAGSGLIVVWLAIGAFATFRMVRRTFEVSSRERGILARVVGDRAMPRLLASPTISQPIAVGLIGPAIVLPSRFIEKEPEDRIEAALTHEWAHHRNGDLWLLAVSRLLLPLLFAHPLYAWLRRRMRADQEAMADAEAAARTGRIAFAEALVDWSRSSEARDRGPGGAVLGLNGHPSSLGIRVALLLDRDFQVERCCPALWRRSVRSFSTALVVGLVLASAGAGVRSVGGPTPLSDDPESTSTGGPPHVHLASPSAAFPDTRCSDGSNAPVVSLETFDNAMVVCKCPD
jgi:beta-lactamase regulating signal transducer with metallopeptidase domain